MRRAIIAAVMGTLMLGGATATPAFAASKHGAVKAKTVKARTVQSTTDTRSKTVVYRGYELEVPASWPVYNLSRHPSTCVRYDRHAVYLGTPGLNMQCPAGLIGHTETVSILASVTVAAGSGSEITYQKQQPDSTGNTRVRFLTAVHATLTRNTTTRELRVELGAAALTATAVATYGRDPAVAERALASLRVAPGKSSAWAGSSAGPRNRPPSRPPRPASPPPPRPGRWPVQAARAGPASRRAGRSRSSRRGPGSRPPRSTR